MPNSKNWYTKATLKPDTSNRLEAIITALLENRGVDRQQNGEFFSPLHPQLITTDHLELDIQEITKALKRLQQALDKKEKVAIYGDYDADGITATAIMWETLYSLGFDVTPFLPHREHNGYGLKSSGIDDLIAHQGVKPDVLITVDNGIVAFEGAQHCKDLDIDLIICDHHEPQVEVKESKNGKTVTTQFPEAIAVIHSTKTAGAGVAYLFATQILRYFRHDTDSQELINSLLELATIGIVADLVPLLSVNRSLVKHGLELLTKTRREGLRALFTEAQLDNSRQLSTYHIGYVIAPRINATGRLEHCLDSLRLLCTKDQNRAIKLAVDLGKTNQKRQEMTTDSVSVALDALKETAREEKILITASEKYNPGVIGLIAGRLVEQFYKPSIAIAIMGDTAKGSVRSIPGVNIIDMLRLFKDDFLELGGHPMAAGFTVNTNSVESLSKKLSNHAINTINDELLIPTLTTELEINLNDISFDLYKEIQRFEPFGLGNPHPLFVSRYVKVVDVRTIGIKNQHLKMTVTPLDTLNNRQLFFEALFFSAIEWEALIKPGSIIDLAYQIDLNVWNGNKRLQLIVKDIKVAK